VVESVRKTGRLIVADESPLRCGIQAEITSLVVERAFDYLDAPPLRVGIQNVPVPFSPPLEHEIVPNKDKIVKAVKELMHGDDLCRATDYFPKRTSKTKRGPSK